MYVRVNVCIYVGIYVCIYVGIYVCMYVIYVYSTDLRFIYILNWTVKMYWMYLMFCNAKILLIYGLINE